MASKLYVGGLSFATTSESLQECFARYGTVVSAKVITEGFSGQSRGFGFVEMSTDEEATAAITNLNGQAFEGRTLKVDKANPQPARTDRPRSGQSRW